jgi:hypothetical protein
MMGGNADVSDVVAALQQAMPGAEINVQGMEVQGLDATAGPPRSPGEDERVAQLERLARLRESGALTEQEFEREKARILAQ